MSRIRSIHPGLWTDEAFVSLSPMARLFIMGIWNECDDMGSFAWSPLTLKMRILPADTADAPTLLAEAVAAGILMKYEIDGKAYGAVRNFCQFQRPKKANSTHPQTEEVQKWVNIRARSTRDGSGAEGKELPTGGEKVRQMEDGGWRGEEDCSDEQSLSSETAEATELKPEHVLEAWNATADRIGLPKVIKLTPERRKKLNQRLKEHPIEDWTEAISAIERSKFLRGEGPSGWRANFDFLLQPSSFTKLIEGTYDHR